MWKPGRHSEAHANRRQRQRSDQGIESEYCGESHRRGIEIQCLFEPYPHVFESLGWTRPGSLWFAVHVRNVLLSGRRRVPEPLRKLSKVTEMDPFGVPFGRLVREKRGIEGLSQDGLAHKSGLPKARISDIETGKIANPQARTVDALCVALNISWEERAACC